MERLQHMFTTLASVIVLNQPECKYTATREQNSKSLELAGEIAPVAVQDV